MSIRTKSQLLERISEIDPEKLPVFGIACFNKEYRKLVAILTELMETLEGDENND
jgi:hypothetical protein